MLIAVRQELVGRRVACQNRIRAMFAGQGLPTPRGHRAWTAAGLAGISAGNLLLALTYGGIAGIVAGVVLK